MPMSERTTQEIAGTLWVVQVTDSADYIECVECSLPIEGRLYTAYDDPEYSAYCEDCAQRLSFDAKGV